MLETIANENKMYDTAFGFYCIKYYYIFSSFYML